MGIALAINVILVIIYVVLIVRAVPKYVSTKQTIVFVLAGVVIFCLAIFFLNVATSFPEAITNFYKIKDAKLKEAGMRSI